MVRGQARSPSDSPWASPIHIVPKKSVEEYRVCGDFRKLNSVTRPNKYPVPNLRDFTSILHSTSIFSTLNLFQAFNQIPMPLEDIHKTAVISPIGLFEFIYMPYALRNAFQTFQRYVNQALGISRFRIRVHRRCTHSFELLAAT